MSEKNASKQSIDLSDLGGRQVLGPVVAVKTENPISLADLGGVRLGQHQTDAPTELKEATKVPRALGDKLSR